MGNVHEDNFRALSVVGILAANPGLEMWFRVDGGGNPVGWAWFVGESREFVHRFPQVGAAVIRRLCAARLIEYAGRAGDFSRAYRLADLRKRKSRPAAERTPVARPSLSA